MRYSFTNRNRELVPAGQRPIDRFRTLVACLDNLMGDSFSGDDLSRRDKRYAILADIFVPNFADIDTEALSEREFGDLNMRLDGIAYFLQKFNEAGYKVVKK